MSFGPWPGVVPGGAFPGFGSANQPVGPSTGGASGTAARSDHQHPTLLVANAAALAALTATLMNAGTYAYVTTLRAWFKLQVSTQAAAALVRIAASAKAGHNWIREDTGPAWWNQTTWFVNPVAGNDENDGAGAGTPLATFAEYRRRHFLRWLPGTETASATVNIQGGDLPVTDFVSASWANGLRAGQQVLTVNGTETVVATGTIVAGGFNAQNRLVGQRNTINAGFSWAAHVGRFVRLQGTPTTRACIMQDLGANVAALGEQSVNGVLGAGFTVGQIVEVVTATAIPGAHVAGPGSPDTLSLNNLDVDGRGALFNVRHTGGTNSSVLAFNSRFISTNGGQVNAPSFRPTSCIFTGAQTQSINAVFFADLCTTVNLPAAALQMINPFDRNHVSSHCSQGPAFTLGENCYVHQSGTGSGFWGIFGLTAGQIAVTANMASVLSWGNAWGSGNDAASVIAQIIQTATWSVGGSGGAPNFAPLVASGVGFQVLDGGGASINIPVAELPCTLRGGTLRVVAKFSGVSGDPGGPTVTYFEDGGGASGGAQPRRYPTSGRTIVRIRFSAVVGTPATPPTATLVRNGVATTMACTLPASQPAGANVTASDSAHPKHFQDADTFDFQVSQPATPEGGAPYTGTLEEFAS